MIERREIRSRETWLEWRKRDVTASAVGALFGCHPYVTPLRLFVEKRGTEFPPLEDNKVLRRGRWMEPAIGKAVMELKPEWRLIPCTEYFSDEELHLGATPDFFIEGDPRGLGILQSKSVAPSVYQREWADGTEVPLWVILQATTECMLADAKFCAVAALLIDAHQMDCAIHELPRNPAAEEKIKRAVESFWVSVAEGVEPEIDFTRDADVVKAMWRKEAEPQIEIDLSGDNRIPELLAERATLKQVMKDADTRIEAIDTEIKFIMKDAAVATGVPGWRLSFKTTNYKSYTVAARTSRILRAVDQREKA